jgi:hypothetical protein
MDYIQEISKALDKETENIAFLAYFPEVKLDKRLLMLRKQYYIARKNKLTEAMELLKIWEQQVLDAKAVKEELRISDNPDLELDMFLPEVEAYDMIEKRQALLKQKAHGPSAQAADSSLKNLF